MAYKKAELALAEREQAEILQNYTYRKSNTLIKAKGRVSLMGQKLFTIALMNATSSEEGNEMVSTVYTSTIKDMFQSDASSLYSRIKDEINPKDKNKASLLSWNIIYENPADHEIYAVNVITSAYFRRGVLKISFNSKLTDYLTDLKGNFTTLNWKEQFSIGSSYGYRLYEILKQQLDFVRYTKHIKKGVVLWETHLMDLKLQMGVIDASDYPAISKMLTEGNHDFDEMERIVEAQDKGSKEYARFSNFKRFILDKAVEEVNDRTSLVVTYEPKRSGRGAKVHSIAFHIDDGKPEVVEAQELENTADKDAVLDEVFDLFDGKLKMKDCRAVAEAAGYDLEKIRVAHDLMEDSGSDIKNVTGWVIKAIQDEYRAPVGKQGKAASAFGQYEQRDYDYDVLAEAVIEK